MKRTYLVTINGHTFTRKSDKVYTTAGAYVNKKDGSFYSNPSFATEGKRLTPYFPRSPREDWELLIQPVTVG